MKKYKHIITFTTDTEQKEKLKRIAEKKRSSVAQIIREAIENLKTKQ